MVHFLDNTGMGHIEAMYLASFLLDRGITKSQVGEIASEENALTLQTLRSEADPHDISLLGSLLLKL